MACTDTQIEQIAARMRSDILKMITRAGSGHPGGSLSATDIVATLYFGDVLRYRADRPNWPERDRFILSKGHAAPVLYAALAQAGYFDLSELATLRKLGSRLQGHPDSTKLPGVEVSTGSLGQGLSVAAGIAYGLWASAQEEQDSTAQQKAPTQQEVSPPQVFVLLGDGELEEGQVWEALMFSAHKNLANLIVIVDNNNLQIDGCLDEIINLGDIAAKFEAFGFKAIKTDGHDVSAIKQALLEAVAYGEGPVAIIAHTIKGKGVSFMENQCSWHGKAPSIELCDKALDEIGPLGELSEGV